MVRQERFPMLHTSMVSEWGREFENFNKKGLLVVKNKFSHSWSPLEKRFEKSTSGPHEKFPPTPMHIIGM